MHASPDFVTMLEAHHEQVWSGQQLMQTTDGVDWDLSPSGMPPVCLCINLAHGTMRIL